MSDFGLPFGTAAFGDSGGPAVVPPADPPDPPAPRWSATVLLGGSDVTTEVTGRIEIEAEESTARLASFSIRALTGQVDPRDWTGAAVVIDYVPDGGSPERLFTGIVIDPEYNPVTRQVRFECSDNLQGFFEGKTESEILALLTDGTLVGRYSDAVFGERRDGWRQAQDVLQTVRAGFDIARDGTTTAFSPWDWNQKLYGFNDSNARDVTVELGRVREIVNRVQIKAEYRYSREHHRELQFLWQYPGLCDFIANPYDLPTRDQVAQAGAGINWHNKAGGICYQSLPPDGEYCNGQGLAVSEEQRDLIVIYATWRGVRRWVQNITENYLVTVQESGSIADFGDFPGEDGAGLNIPNDDASWNNSLESDTPESPSGGQVGDYEARNCGESTLGPGESWAWTDKGIEADRENFLLTLLQIGERRIEESHRQNYVSWQTWIIPDLERSHALEINAGGVQAEGKVFQYRHVLDFDQGYALTTIKVAIRQCADGGTDDGISLPAQPDTTGSYTPPAPDLNLPTYIGFEDGAPVYDENWNGFTTNRSTYGGAGVISQDQIYPVRFQVIAPDIESEAVDNLVGDGSETQEIQVKNDLLVLNV